MGVHLQTMSLNRNLPLAAGFLVAGVLAVAGLADPPSRAVDVVPGGVAAWKASPGDRCSNGSETWEPLGGVCYFGVDVRRGPGPVVVTLLRNGAKETAVLNVLPSPYAEERLTLDKRKVTLSKKDKERARREWEEVASLFDLRGPARFTLPLAAPLAGSPLARNFGTSRVLNGEARSPHGGADFKAATGTPVLAIGPGRVAFVASHFFSGKAVYVDHGDGLVSMSMHLSRIDVKKGQEVRPGDRLGLSGATGRVSGPHLHFGLRWRGATIDPSALVGPAPRVVAVPSIP
jgi:murein DD-endopeptidase MepM/ murein hydrolase activator NlpD